MAESIENLVKKVMEEMNNSESQTPKATSQTQGEGISKATKADYPIADKHPEWVQTSSGKSFDDITLEGVLDGSVTEKDVRITPEILNAQAAIAEDAGRPAIRKNFDRAAELVAVPDELIFDVYNALRPYRSTKQELLDIADKLENEYDAKVNAAFVREAAERYVVRKKLKGDN